ncbi:MAG: bifunctional phosphoribosylaminoimidazolecarboxamide formyltransferase/IMP cyclohydrolase [Candidatus Thermoplasmatota archaeon]|nr:bifunctional phosphoribosylaminoimidazolecarboxamide formyltransferase/IMP cyclohydrolase [Candidatus Thermoplasmatota archaeon]
MKPETALVSVYDKSGIVDFCSALDEAGVVIVSTGGTAGVLDDAGIPVVPIEDITGFANLMDGRVKTLHTDIYAGLLARRGSEDMDLLIREDITPIDMVVCNFYDPELGIDEMDIGGPCMVRAAAKNWRDVVVVSHPSQYQRVAAALPDVDEELRRTLAYAAVRRTAFYDASIAGQQDSQAFPELFAPPYRLDTTLRYGENPHQRGAFYRGAIGEPCVASAVKLQGKEISYNNILDASDAIECVKEFDEPTVVIMKHATPSGVASSKNLAKAWDEAYATDEYSPFGGVVAVNRDVDRELAGKMTQIFLEVVIAPGYTEAAREILEQKENLRLLEVEGLDCPERQPSFELRSVGGGLLVQDRDIKPFNPGEWEAVTEAEPTPDDIETMVFAAKCVKHVKSNAIVFAKGTHTVAIGGGQTSRVDASWIATKKGGKNVKGSVMASDAFFPFRDAVDVAAKAGIRAIVQPGGSIRDSEVIEAANEHDIPMVFTGRRYFLH